MADTHETIADIIADMRDEAARADMEQGYSLDDAAEMMREFASRIDAAWKRERENYDAKIADLQLRVKLWTDRSDELVKKCVEQYAKLKQVGNIAKLRDALVKARRFIDSSPLMSIRDNTGTIARGELCAEIDAALAAPATAEKSSAVGDAAKLREALAKILGIADHVQMRFAIPELANQEISELKQIAEAALAAPPRNCDKVKTSWDVLKKWHEGLDTANDIVRMLDWLLAPATETEGGEK